MSTITSITFLRRLGGQHGVVDLGSLDEATQRALTKTGATTRDLAELAGVDRRVQGNEFLPLFALMDAMDGRPKDGRLVHGDDDALTPAGELFEALVAETEKNRKDPRYARPGATTPGFIDEKLIMYNAWTDAAPKPKDVRLALRGIDQFSLFPEDVEKGNKSCFAAAVKQASDYLATHKLKHRLADHTQVIQVAYQEDIFGRLETDRAQAELARAYIDAALDAGLPVVVGVSYADGRYNFDRMTDHFVTVHERGHDEEGRIFYGFKDPGAGGRAGRFYVDRSGGNLFKEGDYAGPFVEHLDYELTQVRTYRTFKPDLTVRPIPPAPAPEPAQLDFSDFSVRP
ncbi:MAG: hypothetical protein HYV07_12425 [Deltaproteobacteria bacterium]|nr:hypothetical protein [Deltaproteobacteria bacterium]